MSIVSWTSLQRPLSDHNRNRARRRLAELTALIGTLTVEQQLLQAELDYIVYPVLDLPPEITSNILVQSIPGDANPTRYTAPLLLTQICRQWREIAFATPELWQSISLDHADSYRQNRGQSCKCVNLLEMWLQHSANRPLFLSFGCEVQMQTLITTSLIHRHRWKEITISSEANLVSHERFPMLTKVVLCRRIGGTVAIQNALALREVSFRTVPTFVVLLPWAQLTTLMVETFNLASDASPMLIRCSKLLHLTHKGVAHHNGYPTNLHALPSLQSLEVGVHSLGIMHCLTLPCLRHLTLTRTLVRSALRPVPQLLSRSACTLQSLSIFFHEHENSNPQELQFFVFQVAPNVVDLTLVIPATVQLHWVMGALHPADILPLMERLVIDVVRVQDDYDTLLRVLRYRCSDSGSVTLESFQLTLRHYAHPDAPSASRPLPEISIAQFRDLAMSGLKTRIQLKGDSWRAILLDTF
ncbi:hypothetical protein C8R44DRAFT_734223 [Mycena epipterygia]|nr:hypothetical protein C8R44DRAFT_734223 [Mycena epipterygia]